MCLTGYPRHTHSNTVDFCSIARKFTGKGEDPGAAVWSLVLLNDYNIDIGFTSKPD